MMRFFWLLMGGCFALGTANAQAQEVDAHYMAVFVKGDRVGYYKKLRKVFADSVITTELMTFTIDAGTGVVQKLTVDESVESRDGKLIRFRHEAAQGERLFRIAGERNGDTVHLLLVSNKEKHERDMPWSDETLMPEGRRLLAESQGLVLGSQYGYDQLFTETMSFGQVIVTVGPLMEVDVLGEKMKLTETREVIESTGRSLEYLVYRDATTKPIKMVAPTMFMSLVTCSEAYAMTPLGESTD
jgi:hypothetical protein